MTVAFTDEHRARLRLLQGLVDKAGQAVAEVRIRGGSRDEEALALERLEAARRILIGFTDAIAHGLVPPAADTKDGAA